MGLQEQIEEETARMNKGETPETPETPITPEKSATPESPAFDILAHYNTNFGLTAATKEEAEEQLKTAYTKYNEIKDLPEKFNQTQTELEQYKTKAETLSTAVDPLTFFSSKDGYIREQLLIKHPEFDPDVVNKIVASDIEGLSPIETLIIGRRLKDGDIYKDNNAALADIEETYGIDLTGEDFDSLTPAKQNAIRKEAKTLKFEFSEIKNSVTLPEAVNPNELATKKSEELRQLQDNLKQGWKPIVEALPSLLDKVQVTNGDKVLFEYAIDDAFKADIAKRVNETVDFLAKNGTEINDNAKAALVNEVKQAYLHQNLGAIMERYTQDKIAAMDEATFRELHNSKPANTTENKVSKTSIEISKEAAENEFASQLGIKTN